MKKVLLIGDYCNDVFIMCDATRLSPEKPVPIATPHSITQNPGMAGNVLANLRSLAPTLEIATLFPEQPSTKTRYVDRGSNQHFLRVDQDAQSLPLDAKTFIDMLEAFNWDAVVMSDYGKGFLTVDNMKSIALLCENRNIPTFLDTKAILGDWSKSVTYVKINAKEFAAQLGAGVKDPHAQCKNLIVTQGSKGMVKVNQDGSEFYRTAPGTALIRDVVGAGDSVLAALVVGYLEGMPIDDAMDFAADVATIAVSKPGVVAVKREEVV